jgi:hypothetical protein
MPRDGDVRFGLVESGCPVVLERFVERDLGTVPRVGAAQLNLLGRVHHHRANTLAGTDNALPFHAALDVTIRLDSHQPFIVSRSMQADGLLAQLHSLGAGKDGDCCREITQAMHGDAC